jgi:hypothetical protein
MTSFTLSQGKVWRPVLKLNVQGHVVRIVREHYLRQDIRYDATKLKDLAVERDTGLTYVVVETSLARKFLELFEAPYLKNLIFPQTLTLEVIFHSSPLYPASYIAQLTCLFS